MFNNNHPVGHPQHPQAAFPQQQQQQLAPPPRSLLVPLPGYVPAFNPVKRHQLVENIVGLCRNCPPQYDKSDVVDSILYA